MGTAQRPPGKAMYVAPRPNWDWLRIEQRKLYRRSEKVWPRPDRLTSQAIMESRVHNERCMPGSGKGRPETYRRKSARRWAPTSRHQMSRPARVTVLMREPFCGIPQSRNPRSSSSTNRGSVAPSPSSVQLCSNVPKCSCITRYRPVVSGCRPLNGTTGRATAGSNTRVAACTVRRCRQRHPEVASPRLPGTSQATCAYPRTMMGRC